MGRSWTYARKIAVGMAAVALFAVVISVLAITALATVVDAKDRVLTVNAQRLVDAEVMRVARERRAKHVRSFLLTRDERFARQITEARDDLHAAIEHFRATALSSAERDAIDRVDRANDDLQALWDHAVQMRRDNVPNEQIVQVFETEGVPRVRALDEAMNAHAALERAMLESARAQASDLAHTAVRSLVAATVLASLLAALVAWLLASTLNRQIGAALHNVQSSSAELQSAANQQVVGAKQLATTSGEITTTIRELLATSRQIAESAQRVVHAAEETGQIARAGDATVGRTQDAIAGIQRQVDVIVTHMLDLGKKTQQIGGILELINEFAEQTNILSINATIEAVGAGESGRRFAVVADEIRRLADRVSGSAREVRRLIDEIRAAANTTVMATEDGSKAVEGGARQFTEVLTTFRHIAERVSVTTEAAREIELSTKQQTTAVEQVNVAIGGVAQAARETEASSAQTLQTSSQLAQVSRQLTALVQTVPDAG